jgi:hypothetical protein
MQAPVRKPIVKKPAKNKRNYAAIRLQEAMQLIPVTRFTPWNLNAPPRPPTEGLKEHLRRLRVFDTQTTEMAKTLLIDALFAEIVPLHPPLKVWKATPLSTDTLTGVADYLIAPDYAYLATPLLCVAEAKRDDFVQGQAQCIAEMAACRWNNAQKGHNVDVYGIVSNGQGWQFYKLTQADDVYETDQYGLKTLPELLGALDTICADCAKNVPP